MKSWILRWLGHEFTTRSFKIFLVVAWLLTVLLLARAAVDPHRFIHWGYWGVFVFNLFGPGSVLVVIMAPHMNIFMLALVSGVGMMLNDSVSWVIGKYGDGLVPRTQKLLFLEEIVRTANPWWLYVLSTLPLPYDAVGLVAGYMKMSYRRYAIPSLLGKITRFMILGWLVVGLGFDVEDWVRVALRLLDWQ